MPYSAEVQDHFHNPRNLGVLDSANGVGRAENPVCGDVLVLYLRVQDGVVAQALFQAQGCPAAIAAGSKTTELLIGATVAQARSLTNLDVAVALGGLPPAKMHCSVMAEEAIHAALQAAHRP